jgi:hypothetical protein
MLCRTNTTTELNIGAGFLNRHNQSGSDEGGSSLSVLKLTVMRFPKNPKKIVPKNRIFFKILGETH